MHESFAITIYGATGFTGRIATRLLSQDPHLRLLIAGRSEAKLKALAASCTHRPEIFVAEAQDHERLRELVSRSEVILNFAGPFAHYAETLIREVAEQGKRYCDISGETVFHADMQERYGKIAEDSGAVILPMAGFDSVPADIGAYLCFEAAREARIPLDRIDHYYSVRGKFNGGTIATALAMGDEETSRRFQNENVMIPDPAWPRTESLDPKPSYEPALKVWSGPFFMHGTNAAVVRRGRYLAHDKTAGQVAYSERMIFGKGTAGRIAAHVGTYGVATFLSLTKAPLGRRLISHLAPAPGEGPSEKDQERGYYKGTLLGRSGGKVRIRTTIRMQGDPGNIVTVLCATETARLLLETKDLPGGFSTVSHAFGPAMVERLRARGARIETTLVEP